MLIAIIAVISCIVISIGLGVFFLIKFIMHFKESEIRNKNIIRFAATVILTVVLGGVNTFLIIKYSLDKVKTGLGNSTLPVTSEGVYKPVSEIPNAFILSRIETSFLINVSGDQKTARQQIDRMAYIELLRAAAEKYGDGDDIDIVDITWVFTKTDSKIIVTEPVEYSAMGKVIKYGSAK